MTIKMRKITIHSQGDYSVGIPSVSSEATIPFTELSDDFREFLRKQFLELYSEIHDVPRKLTEVWFDDECPDCNMKLSKGNCPRCVLHQI